MGLRVAYSPTLAAGLFALATPQSLINTTLIYLIASNTEERLGEMTWALMLQMCWVES
jgi:hypothetical protein